MIAALANHLWQSTLFALFVGLLTLMVRRNGAAVRYGLWFAASVKFLVPFALIAAAGGAAVSRLHIAVAAPPALTALAPVVQPIAQAPIMTAPVTIAPAAMPPVTAAPAAAPLPVVHAATPFDPAPLLLAVWALGLVVILLIWAGRWSGIRAALRASRPAQLPAPVPVMSTPFPMEPGVIGVVRPVVIVPEGIAERLSPAEWQAVLAHELSHIRRRDNLTGLIHMGVQALFWFHPLVWWLGSRLVAEREQACDEAVVRSGADAHTYAEGILKVCRLYVQQPLACAAGVSGADLKGRVQRILAGRFGRRLGLTKKAALAAAAVLTLAAPLSAGLIAGSPVAARAAARIVSNLPKIIALPQVAATPAPEATEPPEPALQAASTTPPTPAPAKPTFLAAIETALSPVPEVASAGARQRPAVPDLSQTAPEPPVLASASREPSPADAKRDAASFVQSFSNALWNADPICIRAEGAPADRAAQVLARVQADARAAGVSLRRDGCGDAAYDVEIRFAADAERAVHDVLTGPKHLGPWPDPIQRPRGANRPIRAWYAVADDLAGGGDYTPVVPGLVTSGQSQIKDTAPGVRKRLGLAIVVVDPARTAGLPLDALSDYVAMLALSQPRVLDRCNALPSVTDLFAGPCSGRTTPAGLTAADTAYLKALYTGSPGLRALRYTSDLVDGMAKRLVNSRAALAANTSFSPSKEDQMPKLVPAVLTAAALASGAVAAPVVYVPPGAAEPRFGGEFSLSEHGAAAGYWRTACYHWHVRSQARRDGPVASPAVDAAFKRFISGLIAQKPTYDDMSPAMAAAVRKNLVNYWPSVNRMGHATVARKFDTTNLGEQLYVLDQTGGITHWNVVVGSDGKIDAAFFCAGAGL